MLFVLFEFSSLQPRQGGIGTCRVCYVCLYIVWHKYKANKQTEPEWECSSLCWALSPACCFCRRNSLVCRGIFFLESAFSADSLTLQCSYSPLVQSHALTSVHRLKILSAGSHTVVWMQENTARIRSTLEDGFCLPKEQGGLKIAAYAVCLYTHTHTHTHTHAHTHTHTYTHTHTHTQTGILPP